MKRSNKRGQSIGEYAILFAIVLGAVVAMQNYVRNRIAGEIKVTADTYFKLGTETIDTTSGSTSTQTATMDTAKAGTLTQKTDASSVMTVPN